MNADAAARQKIRDYVASLPFTWTEEYRHACEVEYCARLDRADLVRYLSGCKKHRTPDGYTRLRNDALRARKENGIDGNT